MIDLFNEQITVLFVLKNVYLPIPLASTFSIFYFLLIPVFVLIYFVKNKNIQDNYKEFTNFYLKDTLFKSWDITSDNVRIITFNDGEHPNAYREIENNKLKIYVGNNFRKLLNDDQLLFALSHEVAHFKRGDSKLTFIIFALGYILFSCIVSQIIVYMNILNAASFLIITFILFIGGLMGFNYIRWLDEYSADYHGVEKLKDTEKYESFFQIEDFYQKDYGLFIDLIFFDHPPSDRRSKNIQKIKKQN